MMAAFLPSFDHPVTAKPAWERAGTLMFIGYHFNGGP